MGETNKSVYQLKISLNGISFQIWRRILIPSDMNLPELHKCIQITMGWTDVYIHHFIAGKVSFGVFDTEDDQYMKSEKDVPIGQLLNRENDTLLYEYDFGDGWKHEITLEKISQWEEGLKLPLCIAGERACPPESCGGVDGYLNLMEILEDIKDPEFEGSISLPGETYDPEKFDLNKVNEILEAGFKK